MYAFAGLALTGFLLSDLVLAGPIHGHSHQRLHEKREENLAARLDWDAINWSTVSYDVNWSTIDYGDSEPSPTPAVADSPSKTPAFNPTKPTGTSSSSSSSSDQSIAGTLSSSGQSLLSSLNILTGTNAGSDPGSGASRVWIGKNGQYTNTFKNTASEDVLLVLWTAATGYESSFVGTSKPAITVDIPAGGDEVTISFASGQSGAFAGLYSDTVMTQYGQISNTWGEYTVGEYGVWDVSREVNMNGHNLEIAGSMCTANMDTCSFQCTGGAITCETGYTLVNCANGSQEGAQYGDGGQSGGCGWGTASAYAVTTTFS